MTTQQALDPVTAGDDETFLVTLTDAAGALLDLTGGTVTARFKWGDLVVTKASPSGVTILPQSGATLGQARVFLDSADTNAITANRPGMVEVQLLDAAGKRSTPIRRPLMLLGQIITT